MPRIDFPKADHSNKNKPIDSPLKSSLLAETSITNDLALSGVSIVGTFDYLPIRKEGFQEQSTSTTRKSYAGLFPGDTEYLGSTQVSIGQDSPIQFNPSELNISQISTVQNSPRKISIGQISAIQGGASQISSSQIDTSQIGVTQIGTHQPSIFKIDTDQVSPFQVGILQPNICQISFSQTSSSQISSPQVGFTQISFNQVSSFQVNPTKIPLPSSISFQQLLSIHTLTPESITTINNSGEQRDFVRLGKKRAMPTAGYAYANIALLTPFQITSNSTVPQVDFLKAYRSLTSLQR